MFGKNSSQYKVWSNHSNKLKNMPKDCQVVNTGSTAGYKAFDYSLWNVKGANLGFQPQPLYYDFEMLKKYSVNIIEGAKILIGIEHFKFYLNFYEDKESDYKYYLWLDKNQIRTYKKSTDWLVHHAPAILQPRATLSDLKHKIKKALSRESKSNLSIDLIEKDIECSKRLADGWNKEFGWEEGQHVRYEQLETIGIVERRLLDMIDYCVECKWIPYIIVLPLSPNLTKLLSDEVMIPGLWDPLERVSISRNVKIINCYKDDRFADYRLYEDALALNEDGRIVFNLFIQKEVGCM